MALPDPHKKFTVTHAFPADQYNGANTSAAFDTIGAHALHCVISVGDTSDDHTVAFGLESSTDGGVTDAWTAVPEASISGIAEGDLKRVRILRATHKRHFRITMNLTGGNATFSVVVLHQRTDTARAAACDVNI